MEEEEEEEEEEPAMRRSVPQQHRAFEGAKSQ